MVKECVALIYFEVRGRAMETESQLAKVGQALINESDRLSKVIEEYHNDQNHYEYTDTGLTENEKHQYRVELLQLYGHALIQNSIDKQLDKVYQWGKKFGERSVNSGVSVDAAMLTLPYYRKVIYEFIREEFNTDEFIFEDYFLMSDLINPLLDQVVYAFTQAYAEYNDNTFKKAQDELLELSVPIVPLTKTVAILPLVGTIDTYRSKELLEKSLSKGTELGLSYLIVDLSGVHIIDTAVAHNIFQLHDALKVVGITAIISGLRPELAQTIVNLGISFNNMKVARNLEQALMMTGLSIATEQEIYKINE